MVPFVRCGSMGVREAKESSHTPNLPHTQPPTHPTSHTPIPKRTIIFPEWPKYILNEVQPWKGSFCLKKGEIFRTRCSFPQNHREHFPRNGSNRGRTPCAQRVLGCAPLRTAGAAERTLSGSCTPLHFGVRPPGAPPILRHFRLF